MKYKLKNKFVNQKPEAKAQTSKILPLRVFLEMLKA